MEDKSKREAAAASTVGRKKLKLVQESKTLEQAQQESEYLLCNENTEGKVDVNQFSRVISRVQDKSSSSSAREARASSATFSDKKVKQREQAFLRKQRERERLDRAGVMKGKEMKNHIEKTICAKAVMAYVEQNMFVWAEFGLPLHVVHQELNELWLKKCRDIDGFLSVAKHAIKEFDKKHADGALKKLHSVMSKRLVDVVLCATIDEMRYWERLRQSRVVEGEKDTHEPVDEYFTQVFLSHVRVFQYMPGRPGFGFLALWQPDSLNESRVVEMYNWKVTQPRKFNCSERHWSEKILPKRGKFDQRTIEDQMNECDSGAAESYAVVPLSFCIHHLRIRPRFPHLPIYLLSNIKWVNYYRFSTHFLNYYRERKAQEVERSVDEDGRKLDDKQNFLYYYCLAYDALSIRDADFKYSMQLRHSNQSYVDELLMVLVRNDSLSRKIEMEMLRYIAMLGHSEPEAFFGKKYTHLFPSWQDMCVHGCNWLFDALLYSFSGGGVCVDFSHAVRKASELSKYTEACEDPEKHSTCGFFSSHNIVVRDRLDNSAGCLCSYSKSWVTEELSFWFSDLLENHRGRVSRERMPPWPNVFGNKQIIGFGLLCDWLWQNVEDVFGLRFCNFEEDHDHEDCMKWNFFREQEKMPKRGDTVCRMHAQSLAAWNPSCIYCRSLKYKVNDTDPATQLNFIFEG